MVLDQAVMNVAISQLVEDFDTTVTTIQVGDRPLRAGDGGLMLTGGKLGDLWGRRRAFSIGLVHLRLRSALTAASWSVPSLMLGWSILEGIGAALVLPALVALVAGNFEGKDRAIVYGVLGGVAGAGHRRRPDPRRLGDDGAQLARRLRRRGRGGGRDPARHPPDPRARARRARRRASTGSARCSRRSASASIVLGVLQASNWGWLAPRDSPIEPFGFALTPFVIAAGAARARRLPRLAAPPRERRSATRWSTSACSASRRCAAGWRCCSPRT